MKHIDLHFMVKGIFPMAISTIFFFSPPLLAQGIDVPLISSQVSTINLPQTGQTKCYDSSGNEINCFGTGQDGEIRAGVAWPNPRFTNPDGTAPVTGDMVLDQLTGLIWARDASTPTVGSCPEGSRPWQQALDYSGCLNSSGYLNHNDWRLPNINELESLVNSGELDPLSWLNNQGFNSVQQIYWSSTKSVYYSDAYMVVDKGLVYPGRKDGYVYVWPVRGGQEGNVDPNYPANIWKTGQSGDIQGVAWPSPRFTDNGDSTVVDNLTGLMWTRDAGTPTVGSCVGGGKLWSWVEDYIGCLNANRYLSYNDWRLPNRKEVFSLFDYSRFPPLPINHPFINIIGADMYYWSSTTYYAYTAYAYTVDVTTVGGRVFDDSKSNYNYIWPVRGGTILEYISTPTVPTGSTSGTTGASYTYSTGGSSSNYKHSVEYQFDWKGDETDLSPWGSATQSKTWTSAGTYNVRARARCTVDTSVISDWSLALLVTISAPETISTPTILSGSTIGNTGISYSYTTGGSISSLGHSVQYFLDWGDSTNSGWLPVGTTSASKSWSSAGTYSVKAQARCATDANVVSSWSASLSVNITVPSTIATNPSGLQIMVDGST